MADLVHRQIEDAPASSRPKNPDLAQTLVGRDIQSELQHLMTCIMEESIDIGLAVNRVLVAKSLDRITHHALNPAEYAMFEIEGIDLRRTQP
jgi:phosphate transport system protein